MILINNIYQPELSLIHVLFHNLKSVLCFYIKIIHIEDFDHISVCEIGALEVYTLCIYTHAHIYTSNYIYVYIYFFLQAELKCQ